MSLFVRRRQLAGFISAWSLAYVFIFYFLFRFDPRFLVPLLPIFAIAGGYCILRLSSRRATAVILIVLLIPLLGALRLSHLALRGDTREMARAWVLSHLAPSDKILVFSSAMHIPTQAIAEKELQRIDPSAPRKLDQADVVFDRTDVPYALNDLTSISNSDFMLHLPSYARIEQYGYILVEPRSLLASPASGAIASTTNAGLPIAQFDGLGDDMSLYNSSFTQPLVDLFKKDALGPDVIVYKLYR